MKQDPRLLGRRVLVVEDNYLIADEMRRVLQGLGCEVVGPAPRARRGLVLLLDGGADLALLDIKLGTEVVYPLAMELARRGTPFMFTTGCEPWDIPEAFRDTLRLEKPITAEALAEAIQHLIAALDPVAPRRLPAEPQTVEPAG